MLKPTCCLAVESVCVLMRFSHGSDPVYCNNCSDVMRCRFMLQRLHRELSTGPGAQSVDALFGHDVRTVNKFIVTAKQRQVITPHFYTLPDHWSSTNRFRSVAGNSVPSLAAHRAVGSTVRDAMRCIQSCSVQKAARHRQEWGDL